jgi:hypothetical protein
MSIIDFFSCFFFYLVFWDLVIFTVLQLLSSKFQIISMLPKSMWCLYPGSPLIHTYIISPQEAPVIKLCGHIENDDDSRLTTTLEYNKRKTIDNPETIMDPLRYLLAVSVVWMLVSSNTYSYVADLVFNSRRVGFWEVINSCGD